MTKVNYSKRRSATLANSSQGRWLLATFATVVTCSLWAATNGAEQVDSGWAIGIPTPLSTGDREDDPHQQMILRRVLEETRGPLLKNIPTKPEPAASGKQPISHGQPPHAKSQSVPRVAARPEGIDGWQPARPGSIAKAASPTSAAASQNITAPPTDALTAPAAEQSSGPKFDTPKIPVTTGKSSGDDDAECDCSGQPAHAKADNQSSHISALPSLADAYNMLPSETSAATASRKQYPTSGPAHEALDAESLRALGNSLEADCGQNASDGAPAKSVEPIAPADSVDDAPAADTAADAADTEQETIPLVVPKRSESVSATPKKSQPLSTAPPKPPIQPPAVEPAAPQPLTKQLLALRTRVRAVLKGYYRKQLNSSENDPWEVMHGMLAYELQSRVRQGGPSGNPITSVGWLCYNKPCKGQALLYVNPEGEVRAKYGVGLQGHLGQLLAMLAQCHVSEDYPIHVGKNQFTVRDLIQSEMKTCYPKSELTFKLIALQHYIDLNEKWVNDQGVEWDFSRLLSEEIAQPIRGAACGGTHRLSGLSLTVKKRVERGEPLDGEYARADEFVKKYQQYAFRLQNRDGSLSTQWFRGAGDEDDLDRRIKTTGHILEWLCYSLSDEELRDQRTVKAVTYLANIMYSNYDHEWEIGPRSHATHALLLYDERVFQPFDGKDAPVAVYQTPPQVAKSGQSSGAKR